MNKYNFECVTKILMPIIIILFNLHSYARQQPLAQEGRLSLRLSKDAFHESYVLVLNHAGFDAVNDADAKQLGEGLVVLAGLAADGTRLSKDERRTDTTVKIIRLYSKGRVSGKYTLTFSSSPEFFEAYRVILSDQHLQVAKEIRPADTLYTFPADSNTLADSRFSLRLEPKKPSPPLQQKEAGDILVYPNPFLSSIYVDARQYKQALFIVVRDLMGRKVLSSPLPKSAAPHEMPVQHVAAGPYLVEIFDQATGMRIRSLKMIKQ